MPSQDALESHWLTTLAKQVLGKKPEDGLHAEIISLKSNNSRAHIKSNFGQDSKQEMSMGGEVGGDVAQ